MGFRHERGGAAMRRERYMLQVARAMLALGVLGTIIAAVLHHHAYNASALDRWIPTTLAPLLAILLWRLLRHPDELVRIGRIALWLTLIGLTLPAWYVALTANPQYGQRLIDVLPPITAVLFPSMIAAIVYLPRPEGQRMALAFWLLLALPILGYLLSNPNELRSAAGMQLAVTLGPASLFVLLLVPLFQGIERKVASLEGERSRMQQLAERDPLTGLYNRRAGEVWLREAVQQHEPGVGVILFDIDRFKQINDRYGHAAGDAVLLEVARRCAGCMRHDDRLMRWGGEEFLALLRGVDVGVIADVAEAMRRHCKDGPIEPVGIVTASFGTALWEPGEPIEQTLQRADEAMYAAKAAGRDQVRAA